MEDWGKVKKISFERGKYGVFENRIRYKIAFKNLGNFLKYIFISS